MPETERFCCLGTSTCKFNAISTIFLQTSGFSQNIIRSFMYDKFIIPLLVTDETAHVCHLYAGEKYHEIKSFTLP